jgi:membrane-bound lytic murein transglycosylase B
MLALLFPAGAPGDAGSAPGVAARPEVRRFIEEMSARHGFDVGALQELFSRVSPLPEVAQAMTKARAKPVPWPRYRSIFVNGGRIEGGVKFWNEHADILRRARETFGVPEEIIVAVLGVETRYGAHTATHPVMDTLFTLAFDYPRRAEFFRRELEQYLLLTREEGIDPLALSGSFAGAMGIPQFMPSSYRMFAVDFDGDGRRDLWASPADAIGSVANYLRAYGWHSAQPVVVRARVAEDAPAAEGLKPERSVAELRALGVTPEQPVPDDWPAVLVSLETEEGPRHWLGFGNFYAITRYNRSVMYAMAVEELGREIAAARRAENARVASRSR